ncbi:site-specific DNA-methyltransferase [Patescibacteria group bacterium]|nr:site-specific DNA-methyltransferase [Patescibacteria group bacterium]
MPVLNWIGKDAVVNHDKKVPFRLLRKVESTSVGKDSQNLIIHGDNLEALKALMPFYYGKIKCIYIDPPYNTGNESWVYNDRVNSPKIKQWLGKVVGRESEDLTRHDKWLCMMYPRLKLLRDLLAEDGAIFVSIDDNEHCNLKQIMDEIFGEENFVSNIIWQKKYSPQNDAKYFSDMHDFIVVYAKHKNKGNEKTGWVRKLLPRTDEMNARYTNRDNDPRGPWKSSDLSVKTYNKVTDYPITTPSGRVVSPPYRSCWRVTKEKFEELVKDNRIWFGENGNSVPSIKRFLSEVRDGTVPVTLWFRDEVGDNERAKKEINNLLKDTNLTFETPKPIELLKKIARLATDQDSIILDSFAGSGTTGHAILDLNNEDGGNRKFILIELEDNVAKDITADRVKQSIDKYSYKDGFEYCELDKPLFNEKGQIEDECSYNQFATYIYFTETQTNIDPKKIKGNYVGELEDIEYYLIYKEKGKNALSKSFLKNLEKGGKKKVVYADRCLIDEDLLFEYNIVFKQIPYEVKVY